MGTGPYDVEVTDIEGTVICSLSARKDSTSVHNIIEELNGSGSCELGLHTADRKCLEVTLDPDGNSYNWRRFIRITRNGLIRFWGPLTRADQKGNDTTIQARGALAAIMDGRRNFGPEPSVTEFGYPTQFSTATPSAPSHTEFPVLNGVDQIGGRFSASSTLRAEGTKSLRLVRPVATPNDFYEYRWNFTGGGGPGELLFFLRAFYYIESKVSPSYNDIGLRVLVYDYPALTQVGGSHDWTITESTPMGKWFPMQMAIPVPATAIQIRARFHSPGVIYWDRANFFQENIVGTAGTPDDLGQIVRRIVEHAAGSYDKSDLNWTTDIPNCGTTDDRNYPLSSNQSCWEALYAYVTAGEYDFAVIPDTDHWVFTGYPGGKGEYKSDLALEEGRNIVDAPDIAIDGEQVRNKCRVLGSGSGPNRAISEAMDTTLTGGMSLESVETAPNDAPIDSLDKRAAESLRRGRAGVEVSTVRCKQGVGMQLIDEGLTVGDTVPFIPRTGWASRLGTITRRVVKVTELPNDVVDLSLNAL